MTSDAWDYGTAYDQFMGRWSALVATDFLGWIDVPPGQRWLDVGRRSKRSARLRFGTGW